MKRRVIIENRSALSDADACRRVAKVIELGRISRFDTQYCYLTQFADCDVATDLNKVSDRFLVMTTPPEERMP